MDTFLKAFHVPGTLQQFLNMGNLIGTAAQSHMKIQSSVWRLHGLSWFLPQSKDMHVWLTGKLLIGLNVTMNVCLFKLALRQTGDLSSVYTAFSPNRSYPMILKQLLFVFI